MLAYENISKIIKELLQLFKNILQIKTDLHILN